MSTMKAALLRRPYEVVLDEVPIPKLENPKDVLLKVELTAICGSDLHPYKGRVELEDDVILGHEFLGTVVETADPAGPVQVGDRAVASYVVNCGECFWCHRGDMARCIGARIFGVGIAMGGLGGGQAEYVVVPNADTTLKKLPVASAGTDEDMLFVGDILTTGYEAVRRAVNPGDTVAVVGAGPVGLCAAMSAVALGAAQVVVIDKVPDRLKEAETIGAIAVNADTDDPADAVLDLTDWRGADLVVEAVGHESALQSACGIVRSGGTISVPGLYTEDAISLPYGNLWLKGITLQGGLANVVGYRDEVTALVCAGKLSPSRIISHRMGLSEVSEAYRLFADRKAMKIVLDPAR
jgi:2-desacetyl-2-hydroxyethyl bacteriochlorophyllide A dehydrogenase